MKKMVINHLYLFSINEKKAKSIPFCNGINVITSSKIDGTKRGKSVVLKSIYYALGADCFFEDKWNINDKITILEFSLNEDTYFIFRHQRLFKIFSKIDMVEIFRTIHWHELSEYLANLFDFSIELPNQSTGKMEKTPVAYNYILNFIDQDKMDGSKFASFKNLGQYSDFKEKVLYYHFNIYNQEYYEIMHEIDRLTEEKSDLEKSNEVNRGLLVRVNKNINNKDYSVNIENLQRELEQSKAEYVDIANKLSRSKKKLIVLRNEKIDLMSRMEQIDAFKNNTEKDIKKLINHECPICHSKIEDIVEERVIKYNTVEDSLYLKLQLETTLLEVERRIELEEERYVVELKKLELYESKMKLNTQEINDILKYKGYIDIRESLVKDLGENTSVLNEKVEELNSFTKRKRAFEVKKREVNSSYYNMMLSDKERFSLQEIKDERFNDITNNFTAGGSNKPIATLIWHINLLKIRKLFNPNAIIFPLVIDSPNNVETDEENKKELLSYLFEAVDKESQLIVSILGFECEEFSGVTFDNIIYLGNEKYHLLTQEDYEKYFDFFQQFLDDSNMKIK